MVYIYRPKVSRCITPLLNDTLAFTIVNPAL